MDLSTTYLDLPLKNPLIASASPLCESVGNIRRMEDAGIAAVVLHSLFEEQITLESIDLDSFLSFGTESFAESLSYFPEMGTYNLGPEGYLDHIRAARNAVVIPIIASLNGYSSGGWIRYAAEIEGAGADALELNIYHVAADPEVSGAEVEETYVRLVENITGSVRIPVAVKLSPYFSATAHICRRLSGAGARGLVLFNRFFQPDIDLEDLEVVSNLLLSSRDELSLRLRWVALLAGRIEANLAVTGGVHSASDILKSVLVGADAAMMTSAFLKFGIGHAALVLDELAKQMEKMDFDSIRQIRGSMSRKAVTDPEAFERANYMRVLRSYAVDYA